MPTVLRWGPYRPFFYPNERGDRRTSMQRDLLEGKCHEYFAN
jgi:hypothetical protein